MPPLNVVFDLPSSLANGLQGALVIDQASEASPESHAAAELVALLDQLPARQAAVLKLRHLNGLGCREASRQLNISRSSISRDEQQALAQLREVLVG